MNTQMVPDFSNAESMYLARVLQSLEYCGMQPYFDIRATISKRIHDCVSWIFSLW